MRVRRSLTVLLCLILFSCGGGSSSSSSDSPPPNNQPITKLVALGDSITAGAAINEAPWPARLSQALGVPVVPVSGPGQTTSWGVSVIESAINDNQPSHIAILLGTNDALTGSTANALNNLRTMINVANDNGVIPIIGTIPVLGLIAGDNRADQISDGIQTLGVNVAQVRRAVGSNPAILVDGIHPNSDGQQRIADAFRDAIR